LYFEFLKMRLAYLLKKYNIRPRKSWSQYFLMSQPVIQIMASFARGVVLEIGPGLGFITAALAKKADKVIAIEKDKKMVRILQKEYIFDNVDIIQGDILELDLPVFDRVISNIPYHLSSPITFRLLEHSFELGVLSYQKEFAQRMVEVSSPKVSRLSLMVQVKADCSIIQYVSKKSFYPQPKTDGALVTVNPHQKFPTDTFFDQVITGLYSHKRKTVKNALLSSVDLTGLSKDSLRSTHIPYSEKRVWSLTLQEVRTLVDALRGEEFLCSPANTGQ